MKKKTLCKFEKKKLQTIDLFGVYAVGGTVSITVQVSPKVLNMTIGQTARLDCNFFTNQPMNNLMVEWTLYPWGSEYPVQVSSTLRY